MKRAPSLPHLQGLVVLKLTCLITGSLVVRALANSAVAISRGVVVDEAEAIFGHRRS